MSITLSMALALAGGHGCFCPSYGYTDSYGGYGMYGYAAPETSYGYGYQTYGYTPTYGYGYDGGMYGWTEQRGYEPYGTYRGETRMQYGYGPRERMQYRQQPRPPQRFQREGRGQQQYGPPPQRAPQQQRPYEARRPQYGEAPQAGQAEADATVRMTNQLRFQPERITVQQGDTVEWRNPSDYVHTVTANSELAADAAHVQLPQQAEPFHSGNIRPGGTFRHTFEQPGTYQYVCLPHEDQGMIGTVIVEPSEPGRAAPGQQQPPQQQPGQPPQPDAEQDTGAPPAPDGEAPESPDADAPPADEEQIETES